MKKLILKISLIITIVIFVACGKDNVDNTVTNDIKYSEGIISDNDFENGFGEYWTGDHTDSSVVIDEENAYSGKKSMRIGMNDEYDANVFQHINGLKPGYYYLEAHTLNEGNQEYCYIYGKGTAQDKCMTAVPRTIEDGKWIKVTVRGIKVEEDGILEIGSCVNGDAQFVNLDNFRLNYETNQEEQYEMLNGGCIGWLDWIEDLGGKYYYEDGTEGDALQIMAESGFNFVRLELYNNPGDYINEYGNKFPAGYKDPDGIFDLAVRARDKGMKIQLSFMYSDYWGNDAIPSDWMKAIEGVEDSAQRADILADCLYSFTKDYMQRLADEGIYPEYVSLGNEMNGGILTPYGCTFESEEQLEAFCKFMDAGYRGVKEVSPNSQIVLHISCNADDMFWESCSGTGRWFFDLCEANNVAYDVIGTSFYPFWAQTTNEYAVKKGLQVSDFYRWCEMMVDVYDKDILLMETGINWGKPGQLSNNGAYENIYYYTPQGQRDYMYELLNAVKSVSDGRCVGVLYWDPVLVKQEGAGWAIDVVTGQSEDNCVETTTFFNYKHIALPVLDAYKYNAVSDGSVALYGVAKDSDGNVIANEEVAISYEGVEYKVKTDGYGMYYTRVLSE